MHSIGDKLHPTRKGQDCDQQHFEDNSWRHCTMLEIVPFVPYLIANL